MAFERILAAPDESGAAVAIVSEGERVVDLVGTGSRVPEHSCWDERSAVTVFSCTKGAVALCVHLLVSAGEVDLDRPVASIWPEFAAGGKGEITTRMLLNHSAAIPGLSETAPADELRDHEAMAERLAAERPLWQPGTRHGYHPVTYGWALGELIRRITGSTVGEFVRERFAERLGLEFWIGLPDDESHRVAPARLADDPRDDRFQAALDAGDEIHLAVERTWAALLPTFVNDPRTLAAELPATNGIATARGLADLYAVVSSAERAVEFGFDALSIERMRLIEWAGTEDAVFFQPFRYSSGFSLAEMVVSEAAFGHSGLGGSIGFADPGCEVSFAFVTDRHAPGDREFERAQGLIDALYGALGYSHRGPDVWAR